MAIKVSATRATRTTTVPFGDEGDLIVTWHPEIITGALSDRLTQATTNRPFYEALVAAVVEWDLLDETGEVLPLDVEVLYEAVPIALVHTIIAALGTDGAGEANGAT